MAEQRTEVGPAYYDGWQKQLANLREENSRLSAEVERMREVLEAVEWDARESLGTSFMSCPLCRNVKDHYHKQHHPTCQLGRALGRPECGGQPMETEDEQIRVDDASALACRMQTEGGDIRAAVARREEV